MDITINDDGLGEGRRAVAYHMQEHQALPQHHINCVVVHVYNSSTWEAEIGRSEVQGHLSPGSELKASLGYMRQSQKIK